MPDLRSFTVVASYNPVLYFSQLAQNLRAIYNNDPDSLTSEIGNAPPLDIESFLIDPDTLKPNGVERTTLVTCADAPAWSLDEDLSLHGWRDYLLGEAVQFGRFGPPIIEGFQGPCGRKYKSPFDPIQVRVL